MGYTTEFVGEFKLDKPLTGPHREYLAAFAESRRMKRNAALTAKRPDPLRLAVGLKVGIQGGYFVSGDGLAGQEFDGEDVTAHNAPPTRQPGLWCQWTPNDLGTAIVWDDGEKSYEYVPWLEYLIKNFLKPWGYVLNGTVNWYGKDQGDVGKIVVKDNKVSKVRGKIVYSDGEEEEEDDS